MSVLLSQFILPSHSVLCLYGHSLWRHLYSCPANRFICAIFFKIPHICVSIWYLFFSLLLRLPRNICKTGLSVATRSVTGSTAPGATSSSTSSVSTPRGTVRFTPWTTSTSSPSMAWWCRPATGPGRGLLLRKSSPPPSRTVGAWPPAGCAGVMSAWPAGTGAFFQREACPN